MSQDSYLLSRDSTETERLEVQHTIWTKNLGYLLHPTLLATLPPNAHIADIGCGAGTWLLELSRSLPCTTTFSGFDIAPAQYPPPASLPSNVSLTVHNAKEPFPTAEYGKYDIIHLRLLVAALDAHEWEVVARNCIQLLKPSGRIQWDEANFAHTLFALRGETHSTVANLNRVNGLFPETIRARFQHGWSNLPSVFREVGLTDVEVDLVSSDRLVEHRNESTMVSVGALWSLLRDMEAKSAAKVMAGEELRVFKEGVDKDIESGAYIRFDIHVVVGRNG